jgi:hypothetical protein
MSDPHSHAPAWRMVYLAVTYQSAGVRLISQIPETPDDGRHGPTAAKPCRLSIGGNSEVVDDDPGLWPSGLRARSTKPSASAKGLVDALSPTGIPRTTNSPRAIVPSLSRP